MFLNSPSGQRTLALEKFTAKFYDGLADSDRCFRQFVQKQNKIALGLNAGDVVSVSIIGDLAVTGVPLVENVETPILDLAVGKQSVLIQEYGVKIIYSKKIKSLAELPIEDLFRKKLGRHAAQTLDLVTYNLVFAVTQNVVSATSATAQTYATNGTGSNASFDLATAHVIQMHAYMKGLRVPMVDGKYWAIGNPASLAAIKQELVQITKYTKEGQDLNLIQGVVGEVYGVVFIEQTNVPTNDIFFFGDDIGYEVVASPEQIVVGVELDVGRRLEIGWNALVGYAPIMQNRIFRWVGNASLPTATTPTYVVPNDTPNNTTYIP